jgi:integrase
MLGGNDSPLVATFANLRWGELAGLRRGDIDLEACEIRITDRASQALEIAP